MENKTTHKTAIITGSSKGIGRAIALKLAQLPYNLVLNYAHDEESAQEALSLCKRFTSNVRLIQADVARRADVERLVNGAQETFGSVDVLINNAGLNIDKPMHDLTDEDWDRVVDTNMKGVFLCSQLASAYMLQQPQGGIILNVGALTGIRGRTNGLNYCASKAGMLVMTKCMAMELAPRVRVNCLIPGMTYTGEMEERFGLKNPENVRMLEGRVPLQRLAEPEEMANVVSFLLSDEARYITGQKIIVDGGEYMF